MSLLTAACLLALASLTSSSAAKPSFPSHYFDRSTPPLTVRHVPSTEGDLHPPPAPLGRHSRLHPLRRRPSDTAPPYAVQMEPLVKYSPRDPLYGSEENKEEAKGTDVPQSLDAEGDLEGGAATLHVAEDKASHQYSFPRYVILREPEPIIEIIVKESNHTLAVPARPPKPREPVHVFYVKYERKKGKSGAERVVFDPPVAAKAPTSPEPLPPVHIPEENESKATPPAIPLETTTLRAVIRPESETVHHPHSRAPTLRVTFGEENKKDAQVVEQSAPQPSFAAPSWPSQVPPFRQLPEQHFRGHQGASRYFQHQQLAQGQFQQSPDSRTFPPRFPPHYSQGTPGALPHHQQQTLLRQQQFQQHHYQNQQKHPLQFQDQHKQQNQQFQRLPSQQLPRIPPYHHSIPTQSSQYIGSSVPPFIRLQHGPDSSPGGDIVKSITHSEQHQFQSQGQYVNVGPQIPNLHPTEQQRQPNGPSNIQQHPQQHLLHHPAEATTPLTTPSKHHFSAQPTNGAVQYNQQQSASPRPQHGTTVVPHSKDAPNTIKQINSLSQANTTPQPPLSTPETTTRKLPDLPDEIPDDLRQQLLSSGILDNADIQILDYDKVGDIPIESLPPEALAGLQGASSENKPISVKAPKGPVEMKVVRYTPGNEESAVDGLLQEEVEETRVLAPVSTSHESEDGFRRYLPLRIAGERFPVPDVAELRGRNVTSVVVLAPVGFPRGSRAEERSDESKTDRLNILVKKPSTENFKQWLEVEKKSSAEEQAVVLLVSPKEGQLEEKGDIFMYDVGSGQVSQLRGELSAAFVRVAKENATER